MISIINSIVITKMVMARISKSVSTKPKKRVDSCPTTTSILSKAMTVKAHSQPHAGSTNSMKCVQP